jgi:hypothetical protein
VPPQLQLVGLPGTHCPLMPPCFLSINQALSHVKAGTQLSCTTVVHLVHVSDTSHPLCSLSLAGHISQFRLISNLLVISEIKLLSIHRERYQETLTHVQNQTVDISANTVSASFAFTDVSDIQFEPSLLDCCCFSQRCWRACFRHSFPFVRLLL